MSRLRGVDVLLAELESAPALMLRVVRLDPEPLVAEFSAPPRWRQRAEDPYVFWDARRAWLHDEVWGRGDCGD